MFNNTIITGTNLVLLVWLPVVTVVGLVNVSQVCHYFKRIEPRVTVVRLVLSSS